MPEFIMSDNISLNIKKIITGAREKLCIVLPVLSMNMELYELLRESSVKNISISVLYGRSELDPREAEALVELKNLRLHYLPVINSRCYYNENLMLFTSMNIHEFTGTGMLDMGILISCNSDHELYVKASEEISVMIDTAEKIRRDVEEELARFRETGQRPYVYQGFCILCNMPVSFNREQPYCRECSQKSGKPLPPDTAGLYCHSCGKKSEVTVSAPLCAVCDSE